MKKVWTCPICRKSHVELPSCFGAQAPWHILVPEEEFAQRVQLNDDVCVVDGEHFFVRGHLEIPILEHSEPLAFSVWSSLSEKSFDHMEERWEAPDRGSDDPYFGWLCSRIAAYPDTLHLKVSVQSRAPGLVPLLTLEPTSHPLAVDQYEGITVQRWHEIAHQVLHG